jgi:phosphate transport system substrate-binding protein
MILKRAIIQWINRTIVLMAALFTLLATATATAEEIRIGGTGNALGAMHLLGVAFGKQNSDIKVTVLPSLGSSGAVKAVPKGAIDIGLSSRPLTGDESRQGAISVEYARTPLVFAVPTTSQVTAITIDQLADIYSGKQTNWPDGSLIRPVLRQPGDDNTRQVRNISPAIAIALSVAEQRPGMPFAMTDQEAANQIENTPGALGVTTLALINSENRQLRALTLDGVEPTVTNAVSGRYPHHKRLFLITRSEPSAAVQHFTEFIRSSAGREILMQTGHWMP